jgi:hypothetical protein
VLLLARTFDPWPVLRRILDDFRAEQSVQAVTPFDPRPGERPALYTAARNRFADLYQLADATDVIPLPQLSGPSFGLPATLLVTALAEVDAYATGSPPPRTPLGSAKYVLERERISWTRLHEFRDQAREKDDIRARAALALQRALTSRDPGALTHSVEEWSAILAATQADHPDRASRLSNLGVALQARFEQGGDNRDLDWAVRLAREALAATGYSSPDRAARLTNLATAMQTRYRSTRDRADLDEAIALLQEAVLDTHDDSAASPGLSNLGVALMTRFRYSRDPADLDAAVDAIRGVAAITDVEDPDRESVLTNLAGALMARYRVRGDPVDSAEAAALRGGHGGSGPG